MFSTTGKTITSVTNYSLDFNWNLFFPSYAFIPAHAYNTILVLHCYNPHSTALLVTKQKKKTQTNTKILKHPKRWSRKRRGKKEKERCRSSLEAEVKTELVFWVFQLLLHCQCWQYNGFEFLLPESHFSHSTLKESDQYDFQEKSAEHSMLNQNKPEGPIAIVKSFIIYNPLDQQWARKQKKKKKRKGMGEKKKNQQKYKFILWSDFLCRTQ